MVLLCYGWSVWGSPAFGLLGDQPGHLPLARDYLRALQDGDFPPRWAATANGGRGSPAFVLYPPLFLAVVALFSLLTGATAHEAMRWSILLLTLATGAAVYFLARAWLSPLRSVAAAVLTLLLPGATFVCLGRGMYPQFLAILWVALLIGSALRILSGNRVRRNAALLVVSAAGLILTHTLTVYIVLLLLLALGPLLWSRLGLRRLAWAGALAAAALLLTVWFWLPQLYAASYVRADILGRRHGYRESTFFGATAGGSGYEKDWQFLNEVGRLIVVAQTVLAFALAAVGRGRDASSGNLFLRALPWVAGVALLVSIDPVAVLLLKLPGYAAVQFCWRWQVLVALWCGVALAALPAKPGSLVPAVTALLALVFFSPLLSRSTLLPWTDKNALLPTVGEEMLDAMPSPMRALYLDSLIEHRPRGSDNLYYLPAEPGRAEPASGAAAITVEEIRTSERVYSIDTASGCWIRFFTYQCPGWTAHLDGATAPIETEAETGLQMLALPPGQHRVVLRYGAAWP